MTTSFRNGRYTGKRVIGPANGPANGQADAATVKAVRERRPAVKYLFACLECGNKFPRTITSHTYDVRCPKCGGYDTEPEGLA